MSATHFIYNQGKSDWQVADKLAKLPIQGSVIRGCL